MEHEKGKFPRLNFTFEDLLFHNEESVEFWRKYDSLDCISAPQNREVLKESSEYLKELFTDISGDEAYGHEIDKLDWLVFSLWDHYKSKKPRFVICLITSKKNGVLEFINPFDDLESYDNMWEEEDINEEYGDYYEELQTKFNGTDFWDFIHTYKKFSWPLVITKRDLVCEEIEDLFKLVIDGGGVEMESPDVSGDEYWHWNRFEDRYNLEDFDSFKNKFGEIIISYYENMAENRAEETEYIYEFPVLMDVADSKGDMWFRSSATLSFGASEPIDLGFWEWVAYGHIKSFYPTFLTRSFFDRAKRQSLRSAIAAIMGRNMSHNIGSHVLWHLTSHLEQ